MKKFTCPECGKVYLSRKPKVCSQCGCPSENFVVDENYDPNAEVTPKPMPAQEPVAPFAPAPKREEVLDQPQAQQVTIEGFMNFMSVLVLLLGIVSGLFVLISGVNAANEVSYYSYQHPNAAPAIISGLLIIFLSLVQFGMIRLFAKISTRLGRVEDKMK